MFKTCLSNSVVFIVAIRNAFYFLK